MKAGTIRRSTIKLFLGICLVSVPGLATSSRAASPPAAEPLAWDAESKEAQAKPGEQTAAFFFCVTNVSDSDVVIDHMQTSCGCTVAKLPSQPWTLTPHSGGKIEVAVDLRGKNGVVIKQVTAIFTNRPPKNLTVKINIPDTPEMLRERNQFLAAADHQAVFKGDCARCHLEPTRGKTAEELYAVACGICHESERRASMVPDLHALPHSTDRIYWQQWITTGKPGSLMPGFGAAQGGPLSTAQIESLADYLDETVPHNPKPAPTAGMSRPTAVPMR